MSNTKGKHIFCYQLSPETFGYTLVPTTKLQDQFCSDVATFTKSNALCRCSIHFQTFKRRQHTTRCMQ